MSNPCPTPSDTPEPGRYGRCSPLPLTKPCTVAQVTFSTPVGSGVLFTYYIPTTSFCGQELTGDAAVDSGETLTTTPGYIVLAPATACDGINALSISQFTITITRPLGLSGFVLDLSSAAGCGSRIVKLLCLTAENLLLAEREVSLPTGGLECVIIEDAQICASAAKLAVIFDDGTGAVGAMPCCPASFSAEQSEPDAEGNQTLTFSGFVGLSVLRTAVGGSIVESGFSVVLAPNDCFSVAVPEPGDFLPGFQWLGYAYDGDAASCGSTLTWCNTGEEPLPDPVLGQTAFSGARLTGNLCGWNGFHPADSLFPAGDPESEECRGPIFKWANLEGSGTVHWDESDVDGNTCNYIDQGWSGATTIGCDGNPATFMQTTQLLKIPASGCSFINNDFSGIQPPWDGLETPECSAEWCSGAYYTPPGLTGNSLVSCGDCDVNGVYYHSSGSASFTLTGPVTFANGCDVVSEPIGATFSHLTTLACGTSGTYGCTPFEAINVNYSILASSLVAGQCYRVTVPYIDEFGMTVDTRVLVFLATASTDDVTGEIPILRSTDLTVGTPVIERIGCS